MRAVINCEGHKVARLSTNHTVCVDVEYHGRISSSRLGMAEVAVSSG